MAWGLFVWSGSKESKVGVFEHPKSSPNPLNESLASNHGVCSENIKMVEVPRQVNAVEKLHQNSQGVEKLGLHSALMDHNKRRDWRSGEDACKKAGFIVQPVQVVPSSLTEADLKISSS